MLSLLTHLATVHAGAKRSKPAYIAMPAAEVGGSVGLRGGAGLGTAPQPPLTQKSVGL